MDELNHVTKLTDGLKMRSRRGLLEGDRTRKCKTRA